MGDRDAEGTIRRHYQHQDYLIGHRRLTANGSDAEWLALHCSHTQHAMHSLLVRPFSIRAYYFSICDVDFVDGDAYIPGVDILMEECWDQRPEKRPNFDRIATRLASILLAESGLSGSE